MAKDEVLITVLKDIFVPTAFTPNGDGLNDVWQILFLDANSGAAVQVFDRYGETVYQSKAGSNSWDGKYKGIPMPAGSYVWMLNPGQGKKMMYGLVMLIR